MKGKKILFRSIFAVALLTLVSFSNVVGYRSVRTSQEELIESEFDFEYCREYLFETIVEISNNKEYKKILNYNAHILFPDFDYGTILSFKRLNNRLSLSLVHLDLLYYLGLRMQDKIDEYTVKEFIKKLEVNNSEIFEQLEKVIINDDVLSERFYKINDMSIEFENTGIFKEAFCVVFFFFILFTCIAPVAIIYYVLFHPIYLLLNFLFNVEDIKIFDILSTIIAFPFYILITVPLLSIFKAMGCLEYVNYVPPDKL